MDEFGYITLHDTFREMLKLEARQSLTATMMDTNCERFLLFSKSTPAMSGETDMPMAHQERNMGPHLLCFSPGALHRAARH